MKISNKNYYENKVCGFLDLLDGNEEMAHMLQMYIRTQCFNETDYKYVYQWIRGEYGKHLYPDERKWKIPPVSIETFVTQKYYLGNSIGNSIFPEILRIAKVITANESYSEGVIVGGIGSGKSFLSQILAAYATHKLLCMENPHTQFKLAPDKDIAVINMGINATQAKNVVFKGITNLLTNSPFFKSFQPRTLKTEIQFEKEKILLLCGNSKETTPIGLNVYFAILDEAAFYLDNDNRCVAEDIYSALQRRIVSRFGSDGMIMMISSPKYEEDFIMRKLEESKGLDENGELVNTHIYGKRVATWKTQDKYKNIPDEDRKYFDVEHSVFIDKEKVDFSKCNRIEEEEEDYTKAKYWEIPKEFVHDFKANPEKAKRDYAAIPSFTLEGFFPLAKVIDNMANSKRENPEQGQGRYSFPDPPGIPYYIHVDLALNKNGKGDYAGLAMGRFNGSIIDPITGEKYSKVYIELVKRIDRGGGHEIDFSKIRQFIYDLQDFGFQVNLVTLDGFQSTDFMQILRTRGIRAEYLSVDKNLDAYLTLKEVINMKRIDIYKHEILERELKHLELKKGGKVDHPAGFTKDVADALAAVVYNCISENQNRRIRMT